MPDLMGRATRSDLYRQPPGYLLVTSAAVLPAPVGGVAHSRPTRWSSSTD